MSKRYGRGQKLKARQALEAAEKKADNYYRRMQAAEVNAREAKEIAFQQFIEKTDLYKYALGEISYGCGRALAEILNQHADQLLGMVIREPLRFNYQPSIAEREVSVVSVRIPLRDIVYSKVVS